MSEVFVGFVNPVLSSFLRHLPFFFVCLYLHFGGLSLYFIPHRRRRCRCRCRRRLRRRQKENRE